MRLIEDLNVRKAQIRKFSILFSLIDLLFFTTATILDHFYKINYSNFQPILLTIIKVSLFTSLVVMLIYLVVQEKTKLLIFTIFFSLSLGLFLLFYSIFFEIDLINIDTKLSSKIDKYYENKVYVVVLVLISISFILRVIATAFILYFRCLILTIDKRKKNEREDSFVNSEEINQHLSLICPDTTSTMSFGGKKYVGLTDSFIEKTKPNYNGNINIENGNKLTNTTGNNILYKIEKKEEKKEKIVKSESGNLLSNEQLSHDTFSQTDMALFEKFETPKFSKKS